MTPDDFREQGHRMVDWIASYMERSAEHPVRSRAQPGEIFRSLPDSAPERPESWDAIFQDLRDVVLPGLTHWQHPRFFGYFPANASGPAILGDLLSSGLGVQGMLWSTSPACTEIETRVLDWLAKLLGLPEAFLSTEGDGAGVIQGTASEAVVVAMIAARERAVRGGADPQALVAYTSTQAHSSIVKAAMVCGVGAGRVRLVGVDEKLRMSPAALESAIETDRRNGLTPFLIAATLGTTSSGAVDPLDFIGQVAEREGAWLHVDAAWAGSALVAPEHRWMIGGVERADTFNFNPHKWLLTNFDCSALWVADRRDLTRALSITPEYLRTKESDAGAVIDYRDWQIPLGRRFRALKLWFVLRAFGAEGLREHIRRGVRHGELFEELANESEWFELACERSLSLVCVAHKAGDAATLAAMEDVNASGEALFTHTKLPTASGERAVIRLAAGGARQRDGDVRAAFATLERAAAQTANS